MRAISGIVLRSHATVKLSEITASEVYECRFSIGDTEVNFASDCEPEIAVGDSVIAAARFKAGNVKAFAFHNLSTGKRGHSGILGNLFVALFVAVIGFLGTTVGVVFLGPFCLLIPALAGFSISYLLLRSFVTLVACIMVRQHRRS